jgi:hypothetical protein
MKMRPETQRKISQCIATAEEFGRHVLIYIQGGSPLDLIAQDARVAFKYASEAIRLSEEEERWMKDLEKR